MGELTLVDFGGSKVFCEPSDIGALWLNDFECLVERYILQSLADATWPIDLESLNRRSEGACSKVRDFFALGEIVAASADFSVLLESTMTGIDRDSCADAISI